MTNAVWETKSSIAKLNRLLRSVEMAPDFLFITDNYRLLPARMRPMFARSYKCLLVR